MNNPKKRSFHRNYRVLFILAVLIILVVSPIPVKLVHAQQETPP